jgi:hypothetical protein
MHRSCVLAILACLFGLTGITQATAKPACRPVLAIKSTHLGEMQLPTGERKWTAIVSVDAARCTTTAGYFELGFVRAKEGVVEVGFREQFIWSSPSVIVGLDFWADESVDAVWLDKIDSCPCRE